jgi:hypothetical protein
MSTGEWNPAEAHHWNSCASRKLFHLSILSNFDKRQRVVSVLFTAMFKYKAFKTCIATRVATAHYTAHFRMPIATALLTSASQSMLSTARQLRVNGAVLTAASVYGVINDASSNNVAYIIFKSIQGPLKEVSTADYRLFYPYHKACIHNVGDEKRKKLRFSHKCPNVSMQELTRYGHSILAHSRKICTGTCKRFTFVRQMKCAANSHF